MELHRPGILHVDTGRHWRGGQHQVVYLLGGLQKRGLRGELVARPESAIVERASSAGIVVHMLPLRGEWDMPSALRLAGILKRGGFNILHLHTSHAHLLGRIASLLCPGLSVVVSRRVTFPIRGTVRRWFKYLNGVEKYLAISYAVRETLVDAGVRPERVAVVPDGVEPARFEGVTPAGLKAELGFPADTRLVGVVGRLVTGKGQQDFLKAAAAVAEEYNDARFVLAGEGDNRAALERQVAELGLSDRVAFAGFRSDVPRVLAGLEVFVMPSHAEGLCTSAIEAMMAGLPVVGTNVGGLKEVIEDGCTGLLVPSKNPERLAEAIGEVLADQSFARRMGDMGRQRAIRRFSVDNMVEKTIDVYEEVHGARCGMQEVQLRQHGHLR